MTRTYLMGPANRASVSVLGESDLSFVDWLFTGERFAR